VVRAALVLLEGALAALETLPRYTPWLFRVMRWVRDTLIDTPESVLPVIVKVIVAFSPVIAVADETCAPPPLIALRVPAVMFTAAMVTLNVPFAVPTPS
jgi:hypothetical protein